MTPSQAAEQQQTHRLTVLWRAVTAHPSEQTAPPPGGCSTSPSAAAHGAGGDLLGAPARETGRPRMTGPLNITA